MGRLAASIDPETPSFDSLQQQVFDIYTNKIKPAISSLEKALAAKRIRTLVTHLSSIIFAGSIGYFAPDTPANLATYAGCEIIGNSVNFQINRKQELDQNPYSIILSARS